MRNYILRSDADFFLSSSANHFPSYFLFPSVIENFLNLWISASFEFWATILLEKNLAKLCINIYQFG